MKRDEKNSQRSSDPLPYTQMDRAAKDRAAQLAAVLDVTRQHAKGSLLEFWELCGDPRELEAVVQATPTGAEPAVVLPADEVVARFKIASGKDIEPAVLTRLGFLEPIDQTTFRVRGMSRYFVPIERRLRARAVAAAGGRARAAAVRDLGGKFTAETGGGRAAGAPAGEQLGARLDGAHPESIRTPGGAPPEDQPTNHPTTSRQPADEPAQRTASASASEDVRAQAPGEVGKPTRPPRQASKQEAFFVWAQNEACGRDPKRLPEGAPNPTTLNSQIKSALDQVGRNGLERAWRAYLEDRGARGKAWPWSIFVSQWERHYNAAGTATPQSKEAPCLVLR